MSFDARSRERLEALGRTLPQKLPLPPKLASPSPAGRKADTVLRHRVELEENPEDLFRALIEASADGSVPPHHLERLRELEVAQPGRRSGAGAALNINPGARPPSATAEREGPSPPPSAPPRRRTPKRPTNLRHAAPADPSVTSTTPLMISCTLTTPTCPMPLSSPDG